jgi:ribonucleoside-diphosphate reductase alpha chain
MQIVKRDGRREPIDFDRMVDFVSRYAYQLDTDYINPNQVAKRAFEGAFDGITIVDLIQLTVETAASMTSKHPDYGLLAGRLAVSELHVNTSDSFSNTVEKMYYYKNPKTGENAPMISREIYDIVKKNAIDLDNSIDYSRDYTYDYFGFKTLERTYLLKIDGKSVERPQHLLMRVALGIHKNDLKSAKTTYKLMSEKWFTHASPTLFNAGTPKPQLSSCFLLTMQDDSINGIYDTLKQCALISQSGGGIGLSIHDIRAKGSYIKGTNGTSNGIVPMLRVFNDTARYVDQGGGKRKGAFAMYIEPWHGDIFEFLDLKKNHGKEEMRARDLFLAIWMPDMFMQRVEDDGDWPLFDPHECPGLSDSHSEEFNKLFLKYEKEGRALRTVKAQDLWFAILDSQIETGTPYILYKDAANSKSNQQNLGTIKSSNLCAEILEYTSKDEVAVCNLASIALNMFVNEEERTYDFNKLYEVAYQVTINLDKVVDVNYYPIPEARNSNMRHRPVGLGVQGLADTFIMMRQSFESDEAKQLNKDIFETIYFAAVTASKDIAKREGAYETFKGSPMSKGQFQFDMWNVTPSTRWNWEALRGEVVEHGVRNSLLTALMPTASTSQILGNNECIEPYTSNMYTRRVLSGEFVLVNKHLVKDLIRRDLWNDDMRNKIIASNGSVAHIPEVPADIKELYKTVWEIKQKRILELAADRGSYVDQTQSMNVFMEDANFAKLTSMHFYAWKSGLKTGIYYLRTKAAADPIKFTVDQQYINMSKENTAAVNNEKPKVNAEGDDLFCDLDDEDCVACGS